MPKKGFTQIGRLAFREEGVWWNAYYAMPGTMIDATLIGSIRRTAAARPKVKQMFMDMMREVVSDIMEESTGVRPVWDKPTSAPEHERTKQ